MMIGKNQKQVLRYLATVEHATLEEIYEAVEFSYYTKWRKYLGFVLQRSVKSGLIERVKRGVYKIRTTPFTRSQVTPVDPNQLSIVDLDQQFKGVRIVHVPEWDREMKPPNIVRFVSIGVFELKNLDSHDSRQF